MTRCDSWLCTAPRVLPDRQLLLSLRRSTGDVKVAICVALAEERILESILKLMVSHNLTPEAERYGIRYRAVLERNTR